MDVNQTKYGQVKGVNFATNQQNHAYKIMTEKRIQHLMR